MSTVCYAIKQSNLLIDCVHVVIKHLLNPINISYKVDPEIYDILKKEWNLRFEESFWPSVDDIDGHDQMDAFLYAVIAECVAVSSQGVDQEVLLQILKDYLRVRLDDK